MEDASQSPVVSSNLEVLLSHKVVTGYSGAKSGYKLETKSTLASATTTRASKLPQPAGTANVETIQESACNTASCSSGSLLVEVSRQMSSSSFAIAPCVYRLQTMRVQAHQAPVYKPPAFHQSDTQRNVSSVPFVVWFLLSQLLRLR